MAGTVREIQVYPVGDSLPDALGSVGDFGLVDVDELRIDDTYQRGVTKGGTANIIRIARNFDWRKFTPIIGILNADGTVSVIDGQHRAAAAKSRGIRRVPVYFVKASLKEAAGAFAAINGNVTPMAAHQIFKAARAAGMDWAVAIDRACAAAGVRPMTYALPASAMKENETLSIGTLRKCLDRHGEAALTLGLRCMAVVVDNAPGLFSATRIELVVPLVAALPGWQAKPDDLIAAFGKVRLWGFARGMRDELQRVVDSHMPGAARPTIARRSIAPDSEIKATTQTAQRRTDLARGRGKAGEWW